MIKKILNLYFSFFVFILIGISCHLSAQELKPSALFKDHMVLQRAQPVPVWGTASPAELVTVSFAGQTKSTTANDEGHWQINLEPMNASTESREMVIKGKSKLVLSDVLVGEVWICSGQSNMQWGVSNVKEAAGLIPFAKNIRAFEVKRTVSLNEAKDITGHWTTSYPNSAVAFSFAYFLEDISNVPVGIILTAWGSSSLEAWMPRNLTTKLPHFNTIMKEFDANKATLTRIDKILSKKDGWNNPEDIFLRRQPNILYNAMMKPLSPFACRGVVWYQGERNTRYLSGMPEVTAENWFHRVGSMKEYGHHLKEWVKSYRAEWQNEDLEFMIVLLPGFGGGTIPNPEIDPEDPTEESWAWMRESQMQVLDLPHTSIINTIDLGDVKNIHPSDKLPVGQRLALEAAKITMGEKIRSRGPMMEKVELAHDKLVVHFKNANGLKTSNGSKPSAFWLADESGVWKPADADIEGHTVILSSTEINYPKYVRYAFAGKPKVNLVNDIQLPAYPFRTDTFEK